VTAIVRDCLAEWPAVMPARHAGDPPLYGRELEQRILRDLLRRAGQGAGSVVLVEGEPGIGKSVLLRQAMRDAVRQRFSLAAGSADQFGQTLPFFALHRALGEQFAMSMTSDPHHDPSRAPGWWIRQIRTYLEQKAAAAPVLVCLDDLQWADPLTLVALRTLPAELKHHAISWLLARTTTPRHRTEHLFGYLHADGAARLNLTALDDDDVASLLAGAHGAPPDRALLALAGDAAGNPALLCELVRGWDDEEMVRIGKEGAALVSGRLPQRLVDVAQRRLDTLSKKARQLLVTTAVLGPACRLDDIATMMRETPATLLPAVEEAMDCALLTAPETVLSFRHELLRCALGQALPLPLWRALHRQYAHILLDRGETPTRAAAHLLQAAHPEDPASLADLDTGAARTLPSAPQTAADLAVRALELTSPADPQLLARAVAATEALTAAARLTEAAQLADSTLTSPLPPAAEARLRCAFATVLRARGEPTKAAAQTHRVLAQPHLPYHAREEALTAHLQALDGHRCNGEGDEPLANTVLAHRREHESHTITAALVAQANIAWNNGQINRALRLLRDAARPNTAPSADARRPQPLLNQAAALVDLRQLKEADHILKAVALRSSPATLTHALLPILQARIHLAQGHLEAADVAGQAALTEADRLGADGYVSTARCVLAFVALRRGDVAAAAQRITDLADYPPPSLYARPETALARAQVIEARQGPTAAISHLRRSDQSVTTARAVLLGDPSVAAWLVRTSLAARDQPLAAQIAATAGALARSNPGFPGVAAAAAHSKGLASGDPMLVAEAAELHPDPWARASAAEDLAVLLTNSATDQAIRHLKTALDGYAQTGADCDQARVRRRLRALGVRGRHWTTLTPRPLTGWDSLTDTEQTVARLVAEGLNNRQIAARIYISTHTVAHHLRNAFRKLQIASRVELARIVIEEKPVGSAPLPGSQVLRKDAST
jgi:DNA-binding NarL/FixJ family response regulator